MSPCPFCGSAASVRHEHDEDGCRWTFIACNKCGVRTRGKWVSHSSDECPQFYEEVRQEWNRRAPQESDQGTASGPEAPSDEQIAALRDRHGITSNGQGIKGFTQVRDFVRDILAFRAPK